MNLFLSITLEVLSILTSFYCKTDTLRQLHITTTSRNVVTGQNRFPSHYVKEYVCCARSHCLRSGRRCPFLWIFEIIKRIMWIMCETCVLCYLVTMSNCFQIGQYIPIPLTTWISRVSVKNSSFFPDLQNCYQPRAVKFALGLVN